MVTSRQNRDQRKSHVNEIEDLNRLILKSFEEIKGRLKDIQKETGFYRLSIEIKKEILIPQGNNLSKNLEKYLGENIAILHIDGKYYIRNCREEKYLLHKVGSL